METVVNPSVESQALYRPPLEDIAQVLDAGLRYNFREVSVSVVECPDLTQLPFTLACRGLCGSPRIVDVGGPPYLLPTVKREKLYDIKHIAHLSELDSAFVIGAGAGPWPYAGVNCEMMVNLKVDGAAVDNHTRIAMVDVVHGGCVLERLPDTETRTALLSNLYMCEGLPGKVLRVSCKTRHGKDDFITSLRRTLHGRYKDQAIGVGGTFLLKTGHARQHVMPDFSTRPIDSDEGVNAWLNFYNMSAPLIAVGTFVSVDPGLDLRVQHFHSFSHHGEGGHYHCDTEPDHVEYLGFFSLAERIYRVDRPTESHNVGRD